MNIIKISAIFIVLYFCMDLKMYLSRKKNKWNK